MLRTVAILAVTSLNPLFEVLPSFFWPSAKLETLTQIRHPMMRNHRIAETLHQKNNDALHNLERRLPTPTNGNLKDLLRVKPSQTGVQIRSGGVGEGGRGGGAPYRTAHRTFCVYETTNTPIAN